MVRRNTRRRFRGGGGDGPPMDSGPMDGPPMDGTGPVPPHGHNAETGDVIPMGGGARRRRRNRRGGSFRSAVGTALTPLALFVAHNRLSKRRRKTGRKRSGSKKNRRSSRRRKSGRRRR
jgi:hypothetical protein